MGSRNCSGVTDGDGAPDDHMVRSEVADGLGEGLCSRLDDLAKRKGKQLLCAAIEMLEPLVSQQTFGDRIVAQMTVAIRHDLPEHMFIRHTVPNPVVEPLARTDVVMLARDEISEDVGALVVGESEVSVKHLPRGGWHFVFWDQATPCEISGIAWPDARPELLTHG